MPSTEGSGREGRARHWRAARGVGGGLLTAVLLAACATQAPVPTDAEGLRAAVDARMEAGDARQAADLIARALPQLDVADALRERRIETQRGAQRGTDDEARHPAAPANRVQHEDRNVLHHRGRDRSAS